MSKFTSRFSRPLVTPAKLPRRHSNFGRKRDLRQKLVMASVLFLTVAVAAAGLLVAGSSAVQAATIMWTQPQQVVANAIYPVVKVRASDGDVGVAVTGAGSSNTVSFADSVHGYSPITFRTSVGSNRTYGTFDAAGNFHMVWQDRPGGNGAYHTFYVKIAPDLSHGNPVDLSAAIGVGQGLTPSIAASGDGKLYIANEEDNNQVAVFESDDGGNTWSNNVILGTGNVPAYTRITVDTANRPHMVFTTPSDVFAADRNSNGSWGTPVQIDNLGTPGGRAFWSDVAASPNGDVFAAWQEDSGPAGSIRQVSVAHWDHNVGKWVGEIQGISQPNASGLDAFEPGITVDSNSNVWVGWRSVNGTTGSGNINGAKYVVSTNFGQSYSAPADAIPAQFDRSEVVNMTFGNGNVYLIQQLEASGSNSFGAWLVSTPGLGPIGPTPTPTPAPNPTPTPTPTPNCPTITSRVGGLAQYEPAAFIVNWGGTGGNGNALAYTVQYWDMTASSTPNWQNLVSNIVGPAAIIGVGSTQPLVNGHIYGFRSQATDGCSVEAAHTNPDVMTVIDSTPPTASPAVNGYTPGSMVVRLNLSANASDNGGSGIATVQLSNDPSFGSYYEIPFTTTLTSVAWNLDAPQYGGNFNAGQKTVYIRYKDNVGNVPVTPPYSFTENVTASASTLTNLQYIPMGDTTNGNQELLNFFNPGSTDAAVALTYYNADGSLVSVAFGVTALSHLTINTAKDIPNIQNIFSIHSIKIASDAKINVETTNYAASGAMDGMQAAGSLATSWYFPDGSSANGRTTSFSLFNPGPNAASVTISYSALGGNALGNSSVTSVPAGQFVTVSDVPANQNFSTQVLVTNGVGIVAGRKMGWPAGAYATSLGLSAPPNTTLANWYFGYNDNRTGSGSYISVFNPNSTAVTLNFSTSTSDGGSTSTSSFQLGPHTGSSYSMQQLAGGAFGVISRRLPTMAMVALNATTNGTPTTVFAEETQLIRGGFAAAVVPGATALATHWAVPGADNNNPTFPIQQTDTIVIANFNSVTAYATLTAVDDSGNSVCTACSPLTIAPHSSITVNLNQLQGVQGQKLAITVDTPNLNYFWRYYHPYQKILPVTKPVSSSNHRGVADSRAITSAPKVITVAGVVVEHLQQFNGEAALVMGQLDPASIVAAT